MNLASMLVALLAISAGNDAGSNRDPVLLDFHASYCNPCKQVAPEIDKLVRNGYPVRSIDVQQQPRIAEKYGINAIPAFVVVDPDGRVLARTSKPRTAPELAEFFNDAVIKYRAARGDANPEDVPAAAPTATAAARSAAAIPSVNPKPWETVVRIKMHFGSTYGFGSGTIIESNAEESIILTCAHIFRTEGRPQAAPKDFRVPITVDLFDGVLTGRQPAMVNCSEKDIPGEAIDYDFTNDVGLIRIRPGRVLPASRVVPASWQPEKGFRMVSVGCSHGNDATAWDTTILDPQITMAHPDSGKKSSSIKCAHQPKQGRSGGGLYTTDGYVAGVCDFADPNEGVGLYAVPKAIHNLLDRNQLTALYEPTPSPSRQPRPMLADRGRARPATNAGTIVRAQSAEGDAGAANPDQITLPKPSLVGIKQPEGTSPAGRPWRREVAVAATDDNRATRRPDRVVADVEPIDPGARPGEALATDHGMTPDPDTQAFDDLARTPSRTSANPPTAPANPPRVRSLGKWQPVPQALP